MHSYYFDQYFENLNPSCTICWLSHGLIWFRKPFSPRVMKHWGFEDNMTAWRVHTLLTCTLTPPKLYLVKIFVVCPCVCVQCHQVWVKTFHCLMNDKRSHPPFPQIQKPTRWAVESYLNSDDRIMFTSIPNCVLVQLTHIPIPIGHVVWHTQLSLERSSGTG